MKSPIEYAPITFAPSEAQTRNTVENEESIVPPPEFIVSRYPDGSTASYYSDLYWDWSPYHPQNRVTRLSFVIWCGPHPSPQQLELISEIQFIAYLLVWHREGMPLSYGSIQHYIGALNHLAAYAEKEKRSVKLVLNDSRLLVKFYDQLSGIRCKYVAALLFHLTQIGSERTKIDIARGASWRHLRERIVNQQSKINQHPPIPTRILSELLSNLKQELEDFEIVADRFLALFRLCAADERTGRVRIIRKKGTTRSIIEEKSPTESFTVLVEQYKLTQYFLAKQLPFRIHSLPRGLKEIQVVAGLLLKLFSGMRNSETMLLPYDCLAIKTQGGKSHYLLKGETTKLNHGRPKSAKWVTSAESKLAVDLCQRIAECIYDVSNGPSLSELTAGANYPLFVAVSYAQLGRSPKPTTVNDVFVPSMLPLSGCPILVNRIVPKLRELDLAELEHIDPYRKWSEEETFAVGKPWPLTSHQLRRSLALYASRSGLVSLPTLRRQLQHITEEMSRYYARGSQAANDIIGDNNGHFGIEYQETQFESQALAYIKDVLLSDEKLIGAHGIWVERHLRSSPSNLLIDRSETLKRFHKGELAYKETIFGGCTKIGSCDKRVFSWTAACISCKHAVGKPTKLATAIKAQEKLLSTLLVDSIEWRIESNDLEALNALMARTKGPM